MMLRLLCCFLSLLQLGLSTNEYLFENINQRSSVASPQSVPQNINHNSAAPVIYEKEFYFFSAPEEKFDQGESLRKLASSTKKHQQVIFIKSPENNDYKKSVENLVQNVVQQKTDIYVLNKEPNYAGLQHKFQSIQHNIQHKPELKFINYRNPSDAHNIQSSIVQQYGGGGGNVNHQSLFSDSTPVKKDYAKDFLPSGSDVLPGTSYIPIV